MFSVHPLITLLQITNVHFHVLGLKCQKCGSYNTCRADDPSSNNMTPKPSVSTQPDTGPDGTHENEEVGGATSATVSSGGSGTGDNNEARSGAMNEEEQL